ncbi:DUF2125 domain-containing protein [Parasulfitobacter algicola]|uniref:DUF2125 domain-containing protein n=1 Tax=Parasulfitobacter algicola TaxID=2614809 RepID=A0ABX2IUV9_9RHOB|nr:DUF2125 domain-containing protein [Sulfitobacter algicola]NSX56687.1 DUF2125 domain-containing protein [Sulfitobacter algicola]
MKYHFVTAVALAVFQLATPIKAQSLSETGASQGRDKSTFFTSPSQSRDSLSATGAGTGANKGIVFQSVSQTSTNQARLTEDALALIEDDVLRNILQSAGTSVTDQGNSEYLVTIKTSDLRLPSQTVSDAGRIGLPATISAATVDTVLILDRPWQGNTLRSNSPKLTNINIRNAQIEWGALQFQAQGDVTVDAAGRPNGSIQVTLPDWRRTLMLMPETGTVDRAELREAMEEAGRDRGLIVPLTITNGTAKVGPFTIGQIPPLVLQ